MPDVVPDRDSLVVWCYAEHLEGLYHNHRAFAVAPLLDPTQTCTSKLSVILGTRKEGDAFDAPPSSENSEDQG